MDEARQARRAKPTPTKQSHGPGRVKLIVAGVVATVLLIGAGIFLQFGGSSNDRPDTVTVSTVRPVETIRYAQPSEKPAEKKAKAGPTEAPNVPQPQGTVRRMEAISGAFSKK